MELGQVNSYRLRLSAIRRDLVNQLPKETDPSDVIRLVTTLDEVLDVAYDIYMDLTSDSDKLFAAKIRNIA